MKQSWRWLLGLPCLMTMMICKETKEQEQDGMHNELKQEIKEQKGWKRTNKTQACFFLFRNSIHTKLLKKTTHTQHNNGCFFFVVFVCFFFSFFQVRGKKNRTRVRSLLQQKEQLHFISSPAPTMSSSFSSNCFCSSDRVEEL